MEKNTYKQKQNARFEILKWKKKITDVSARGNENLELGGFFQLGESIGWGTIYRILRCFHCWFWTGKWRKHSAVNIVNFEQVNVGWMGTSRIVSKNK